MSLDRRTFVASLASAGALAGCAGSPGLGLLRGQTEGGQAANRRGRGPHAAAGIPLTVDNLSGYDTSAITIYVLGYLPAANCAADYYVYMNSSGSLVKMESSPVPGLPLSSFLSFDLPYLVSGRIYFAIDGKLSIPVSGGIPTLPSGWNPKLNGATNPNYDVLFDWFEYTCCGAGETLTVNTTQVDMFGLPLAIGLNPSSNNSPPGIPTVGVGSGKYADIYSTFSKTADVDKLIVTSGGKNIRILAPGHGISDSVFPKTYLDDYINSVISYYEKNEMTLCTNAYGTYKGKISGGDFTFTYSGGSTDCGSQSGNVPDVKIATSYLSTLNVLECAVPGGTTGPAARIYAELYAGFNRGTLLLSPSKQPVFTTSDFYKTSPTNEYSKIIHANSLRGLAYGFADDDQGSQSSTLANAKVSSVKVSITSMT